MSFLESFSMSQNSFHTFSHCQQSFNCSKMSYASLWEVYHWSSWTVDYSIIIIIVLGFFPFVVKDVVQKQDVGDH